MKKFLGWCMCLGYALAGYWIGQQTEYIKTKSLKALLTTHSVVILCCLLAKLLGYQSSTWIYGWRLGAFFQNPNAFGLFCVTAIIITLSFAKFSVIVHHCLIILSTLGILYSHSRTAVLLLFFILLTQKWWRQKISIPAGIIVGCLIFGFGYALPESLPLHFAPAYSDFVNRYHTNFIDHGAWDRIQSSLKGLKMWQAQPLTGIDLGGFLQKQRNLGVKDFTELHSTYLWLLIETGVIGFLLMSALFVTLCKTFFTRIQTISPHILAFRGILITFAVAALVMEVLYQRYLWVFFGLALAHCGQSVTVKSVPIRSDDILDTNLQSASDPAQYPSAA
ncbi:MAG: O-antigen ligase family protein [Pseudomonadota bacterium]